MWISKRAFVGLLNAAIGISDLIPAMEPVHPGLIRQQATFLGLQNSEAEALFARQCQVARRAYLIMVAGTLPILVHLLEAGNVLLAGIVFATPGVVGSLAFMARERATVPRN